MYDRRSHTPARRQGEVIHTYWAADPCFLYRKTPPGLGTRGPPAKSSVARVVKYTRAARHRVRSKKHRPCSNVSPAQRTIACTVKVPSKVRLEISTRRCVRAHRPQHHAQGDRGLRSVDDAAGADERGDASHDGMPRRYASRPKDCVQSPFYSCMFKRRDNRGAADRLWVNVFGTG